MPRNLLICCLLALTAPLSLSAPIAAAAPPVSEYDLKIPSADGRGEDPDMGKSGQPPRGRMFALSPPQLGTAEGGNWASGISASAVVWSSLALGVALAVALGLWKAFRGRANG